MVINELGGGGRLAGEHKELSQTGFTSKIWKIGWMHIEVGILSLTAEGLRTSTIGNGPINWGANFLGVSFKLMSQVNSHTFWLI